jgi:hypothetical protein
METKYPNIPWLEPIFFENQKKVTPEMVLPYAGQFVAWSWDGSRILAADPDREGLDRKLSAAGIDNNRVVIAYVDDPEVTSLM